MTLSPEQILENRYRIDKLLGQGGFGAVYKAWDLRLDLECAVKENLETTPEVQRQFEREAGFLRTLHHPNLPHVTDYFAISGQGQYLVMDYVEGEDLQEKLDQSGNPLSESQVIYWMIQICDALVFLHNQNPPIIHRDIKPANIRITRDGNAMLVDFGIAKTYNPSKRTTTGARAVSHGYSPLEQYGGGRTDQRSDIYSLGATIYALLTGDVPLGAPERNQGDKLLPPREYNPAISIRLKKTILHALEIFPEKRFQRISDFKTELEKLNKVSKISFVPSVVSQPTIQPKKKFPIYWIGLFCILLTSLGATYVWFFKENHMRLDIQTPVSSSEIEMEFIDLPSSGAPGTLTPTQILATYTSSLTPTKTFTESRTPTETYTISPSNTPTGTKEATIAFTPTSRPEKPDPGGRPYP